MKTIVRRVAQVALLAIVTLAIGFFVLVAVGPRTGRYRTLTVLSASMRPTFDPGSIVIVRPTPVADLAVGDVITYRIPVDDRRVVTHRIIEIVKEDGGRTVVRTQGDANNAADPWLARLEGDVAWRADASVPAVGYAISALREPLVGRALVTLCPLLLCVLWLAGIWRRPAAKAGHPSVSKLTCLEAVTSRAHSGLTRHSCRHCDDARASGADRVLRWTDDQLSGRRRPRTPAAHA